MTGRRLYFEEARASVHGKAPVHFQSDEWKAKILDPVTAIKWALDQEEHDDDAMVFLREWNEGAVFGGRHFEYRYWATGVHEPDETEPTK